MSDDKVITAYPNYAPKKVRRIARAFHDVRELC